MYLWTMKEFISYSIKPYFMNNHCINNVHLCSSVHSTHICNYQEVGSSGAQVNQTAMVLVSFESGQVRSNTYNLA